jgi:hypothetical protein
MEMPPKLRSDAGPQQEIVFTMYIYRLQYHQQAQHMQMALTESS